MFEPSIVISDDFFQLKGKKVFFRDIFFIREYKSHFISKYITPGLPRAELFLKNGKIVVVPPKFNLINRSGCPLPSLEAGNNEYKQFLQIVRKNSIVAENKQFHWIEWRLILPVAIIEIIFIGLFPLLNKDLDFLLTIVPLSAVIVAIPCFIWDRYSRKNYIRKLSKRKGS